MSVALAMTLVEVRCRCGSLLGRFSAGSIIQIKCRKCSHITQRVV